MLAASKSKSTLYRHAIWQTAQALGYPAALWQLPKTNKKYILVSFVKQPEKVKLDFKELESGFAFSPFLNLANDEALFLRADLCLCFDENDEMLSDMSLSKEKDFLIDAAVTEQTSEQNVSSYKVVVDEQQKKDFMAIVNQAIKAIRAGEIQKVVLSRCKEVQLNENFNVLATYDSFCETYPNAFVSAVSLPHLDNIWIGASPEKFLSQDTNGIFRTMALAGTQAAIDMTGQSILVSEAMWSQKEIEEQSLVCRYIINCFKKIRLREYVEEGPKTVVAGNLMHLQTDFMVNTQAVSFPQLASVMLELLHPTSAVCGMPKEQAINFILQHEGYDRAFYSGFLGPVNIENSSDLYVNLRTMKIQENKATLYAGCGITADSNPEKEWLETEMKCQTILNVLENELA